jgi:hypothetical protein
VLPSCLLSRLHAAVADQLPELVVGGTEVHMAAATETLLPAQLWTQRLSVADALHSMCAKPIVRENEGRYTASHSAVHIPTPRTLACLMAAYFVRKVSGSSIELGL